jgi:hypothetical protein
MGVLYLCVNVSAQKINTDSLKLIAKISEDQLKLGKLQNMVEQKTRNKEESQQNNQRKKTPPLRPG